MRKALCVVVLLGACGDDPATPDATATTEADTAVTDTIATETTVADTTEEVDAPPPRAWRNRALGGMSMGAAAISIALEHPGAFDVVGALGGYPDASYMMSQMLRTHFGGFCPLDVLEANVASLDVAGTDSPVYCGPGRTLSPLEHVQDFNHLFYDDNGITMKRGFYADVIDNFSAAYGNLATSAHPDAPLYPAGVDLTWYRGTDDLTRCADAQPIDPAFALNAEYNPTGAYDVIPLCEMERPADPELLPSWYEPGTPLTHPVQALLAVDINGNGRRDFGEPLFLNPWERFDDVGTDGCPNDREVGDGTCRAEAAAVTGDPNGDDYDWVSNPSGTEADDRYALGEPFRDLGLDGVDAQVSGVSDHGEGNGTWDAVPAFDDLLAHDADTLLKAVDAEALDTMDFWFDAGIRDALNAGVVARNLVAALRTRGREITLYHGFAGTPDSILPDALPTDYVPAAFAADFSAQAIGRDVYVEYGNPNATEREIADGDGKHVGTDSDALNRIVSFLAVVFARFPDADREVAELGRGMTTHFYSPALGGRRNFTIGLPPGYDENPDKRYPVLFFLHGLGQDSNDLGPALIATSLLMADGSVPKAIIVFPDGACCFVDRETGQRECACQDSDDGTRACVDPACQGAAETCEVRHIPDDRLERECHLSSLFADMKADRWGNPTPNMGYATSVMELVRHVDERFRTSATPLE